MPANSPTSAATGVLPKSAILAEASPDSLSELFSRDPEGYSEKDLDAIVDALRAQRARWTLAQNAAPAARKSAAKAEPRQAAAEGNLADLGL